MKCLALLTKIELSAWPKIKARLIDPGMIVLKRGGITIPLCQELIAEATQKTAQARSASAEAARKSAHESV